MRAPLDRVEGQREPLLRPGPVAAVGGVSERPPGGGAALAGVQGGQGVGDERQTWVSPCVFERFPRFSMLFMLFGPFFFFFAVDKSTFRFYELVRWVDSRVEWPGPLEA